MLITATTTLFPKSSRLTTGTKTENKQSTALPAESQHVWIFKPRQSNFLAVFLSLVFFRSRESEKF